MKSFDIDAKYLIKKYIDSIEEYFHENTKLHPNEIDGLLNEINDFIYIRSGEIATDPEKRVSYTDVLKAIDECGSPSEICEQYLEQDQNETIEHFLPRLGEKITKIRPKKGPDHSPELLQPPTNKSFINEGFSRENVRSYLKFYIKAPLFSTYRITFLLFIGYLLAMVIITNPIQYISTYHWREWVEDGTSLNIETYMLSKSTMSICLFMTLYFSIIVLWESFIINNWKNRLTKKKNVNRKIDDSLILLLSRFGFLIIFFKASILLSFEYLLFIPIWILVLLIIERQMKSKFWQNQLAPKITIIGLRMSLPNNTPIKIKKEPNQLLFKPKTTNSEILLVILLLLILTFTFLFPFIIIRYGYQHAVVILDNVPYQAIHFSSIALIAIFFIILYLVFFKIIHYFNKDKRSTSCDYTLLNWMIRLITLKTVIIIVSYTTPISSLRLDYSYFSNGYFLTFLVLLGWFITEILINSYGVKFTRRKIGKALIKVGDSPTIYIGADEDTL